MGGEVIKSLTTSSFRKALALKNLDAPHARNAIVETGVFNLSAVCTTDMTVPSVSAAAQGFQSDDCVL
jgi:hypothetical protein